MIKNIIFDMGNILMRYCPEKICQNTVSSDYRQLVLTYLLHGPEWKMLDKGVLTADEALARIYAKLHGLCLSEAAYQTACHEVAACLAHWYEWMDPITEMDALIQDLKSRGLHIYLCSNASLAFFEYYQAIPGIQYFDGLLVSAEEKCIKPNVEIYQRLFEKFHLRPEECFFIDDMQENIAGAKRCGMDGYCLADRNIEKLKKKLKEILA